MDRREVLASLGCVTSVGIAGCLDAVEGSAGDDPTDSPTFADAPTVEEHVPTGTWPQVGFDAQNTRHARGARGPRDDGEVAWTALGDRPVSPPVVGDALYLTEDWTDGTALSLAADDGEIEWSNADLPPIRWAPALHHGTLLVLTRAEGNVVRLHALDVESGEQSWVRERGVTASASSNGWPFLGPTVRDGTVYVASERGVVACDAATGDLEWEATLSPHLIETEDGPSWRSDWATPAVTDDRVFTFDRNDSYGQTREVYAVTRDTGDRDWTADLETADGWSLRGHVVAGTDRVFVSALEPHTSLLQGDDDWSGSERLYALDATTGNVDWQWDFSRKSLSPPAYAAGVLYVGEWYPDADSGRLHALDATDGSNYWTYTTDEHGVSSPTVAGDTVYVAEGSELAAVAATDGDRRWRLDLGSRVGPPAVVGDSVYVTTTPGHGSPTTVYAVREP